VRASGAWSRTAGRSRRCVTWANRSSVASAAERIAGTGVVDLSAATVERFLYELAEAGVVERVPVPGVSGGAGRPPSRLTPRFSPTVFQQLADPPDAFE